MKYYSSSGGLLLDLIKSSSYISIPFAIFHDAYDSITPNIAPMVRANTNSVGSFRIAYISFKRLLLIAQFFYLP